MYSVLLIMIILAEIWSKLLLSRFCLFWNATRSQRCSPPVARRRTKRRATWRSGLLASCATWKATRTLLRRLALRAAGSWRLVALRSRRRRPRSPPECRFSRARRTRPRPPSCFKAKRPCSSRRSRWHRSQFRARPRSAASTFLPELRRPPRRSRWSRVQLIRTSKDATITRHARRHPLILVFSRAHSVLTCSARSIASHSTPSL